MKKVITYVFCMVLIMGMTHSWAGERSLHNWNQREIETLKSLYIGSLPPLRKDPSNRFDQVSEAIALGRRFFFENRFSGNMKVSCATCHPENMNFADSLPLAHGMGTTKRRTMPLIGVAYSPWLFWDGRKDSTWAQALGPIESPVEHGFTRTKVAAVVKKYYKDEYEKVFGPMPTIDIDHLPLNAKPSPDEPQYLKAWVTLSKETREAINQIYVNVGKAIGAFVRTIIPTPSRFDKYVSAVIAGDTEKAMNTLSDDEVKGLRLFIGKAKCINCHNGPMLTDYDFHAIGVPDPEGLPPDQGRAEGIPQVLTDEFNCLSKYSDARPRQCRTLRFMSTDVVKYRRAFKTPTLRNVADRAPYMHAGQFMTLHDVLHFYRDMPEEKRPPDLEHGDLSDQELVYLEEFLKTLSAPPAYFTGK